MSDLAPAPDRSPTERPASVTAIAAVWGVLMVVGAVQGVLELVGLVTTVRGILDGGSFPRDLGLSLGAGLSGWAIWRGLLKGRRKAWATVRRISWIAGPLFGLATVVLLLFDPANLTVSGPGGEIRLDDAHRWVAVVISAVAAVLLIAQAVVLGRPSARAWFDDDGSDGSRSREGGGTPG